ncbi:MAG: HlyD family efflux transporter periplasmic adaptor subunit [Bacteroidia bacterium]|nr:HlyD family efflux transporter periplasmic adaptor subunit [Bacteroidia bacterium]
MNFFNADLRAPRWLGLIALLAACQPAATTLRPERITLTEAVYASGMLLPETEYKVYANTDGILVQAFIDENDTIISGQPLFRIESNARKVQESLLSDIYQTTQARSVPLLKDLDNKLASLSGKLTTDSLQYARMDVLVKTGAVSQADWERARLQYETTQRERQSLLAQRQNLVLQTRIEASQAENQYRNLQAQNQDGLVRSLLNGVVFEVYKKAGERVGVNEALALAGTGSGWIARLTLDERDYTRVQAGQQALIKLDAYPDRAFRAQIREVLPKLNRSEQSFYAEAVFLEPLPSGLYGLNLEANILIREKTEALTLPRHALSGDSVQVERDGKPVWVRVRTGIGNIDRVEVLEGITEQDVIVLKK